MRKSILFRHSILIRHFENGTTLRNSMSMQVSKPYLDLQKRSLKCKNSAIKDRYNIFAKILKFYEFKYSENRTVGLLGAVQE